MACLTSTQTVHRFRRSLLGTSASVGIAKERSALLDSADEALVALAQQGDRRAVDELVNRHKQKAYNMPFGFARDREDAKDLSQEEFLKAFNYLKTFHESSSFLTCFY